jgi:competence ComEA-like helix-hairpin-helix protein
VGPYTRPQALLLLGLVAVAGVGLGIGHWRRAHPELAAQLERFDQTADSAPASSPAPSTDPVPRTDEAAVGERPPARAGQTRAIAGATRASLKRGTVASTAAPVDLNRATAEDLMRLPGVGPVLAGRILAVRESDGPFTSVEDLRRVSGVGAARIERYRSLVTISVPP